MRIDRYKNHDIEVVVDRLTAREKERGGLKKSLSVGNEAGQRSDHDSGKGWK